MSARLSRRRFLGLGAAAVGVGAVAAAGRPLADLLLEPGQPGRLLPSQTPLPRPYRVPLPIPQVLRPVRTDGATDQYELTQRIVQLHILPDLPTSVWTYGGSFPGPTIVSRAGRQTAVRHRNELPQPVAVHLHGGHTPADSDGYPIDLIPGPRRHLRRTRHPAADNGNRTGLRSRIRRPDRHDGRPLGARPRAHPRPRTPHVVAQLAIPSGGRVGPEASPAWHAGLFGSATAGVCVNTAEPDTPAGAIGHLA